MDLSHSIFFNNRDNGGYTIFNETWGDISISNNWWGLNRPDFNQLLNFDTSDDFTWIVMNVTNTTPLIQGRTCNVNVNFTSV